MSIEAMSLVLHHSKAQGAAKLVLLGIANHHSEEAGAWPSIATLSKYASVSERRVQQIVRELEQTGELVTMLQRGGQFGQYKTNRYFVSVSCPENCDRTSAHRSGVKPGNIRGEARFTPGVKPIAPEPLENRKRESILPQTSFEEEFNEFWKAYPRKVERLEAKKAFEKAFKTHGQSVIDGARRMAEDPNIPPKQFIPYPASWLNAGGWDNEPFPERQKSKEELQAEEMERIRKRDERDRERRRIERLKSEQEKAEFVPVTRCEHDRIPVRCPQCMSETRHARQAVKVESTLLASSVE
jgi:hypothetical protein